MPVRQPKQPGAKGSEVHSFIALQNQAGGSFDMRDKDDGGLFAGNGWLHLMPSRWQSAPALMGPARQVIERAAGVDYRRFKQAVRVDVG